MSQASSHTPNRRAQLLSFLFFASLISLSMTKCIHDQLDIKLKKLDLPIEDRFLKETSTDGGNSIDENDGDVSDHKGRMLYTAKGFRIYADYSNLAIPNGANRDFIVNVLMPAAISYYGSALKVNYPISGYLSIPASVATECTDATPIPSYLRYGGVLADLILFVTASTDDASYIAYASACLTDSVNRPVAGEIHFNLKSLDPYDKTQILPQVSTVLHETAHVLGFSSALFDYFIDPVALTVLPRSSVVKSITRNGVSVNSIVMPTVLNKAKLYFGCATLDGVDLEDQGGAGSAGSHWERKILWNEVMTASDLVDIRYSQFTLAFLEGTGWYTPNYDMADPMTWGKNEGCNFISTPCVSGGTASFKEFCTPKTNFDVGCVWGGQYKGICYTGDFDYTLDSNYNYFGATKQALDPFVNNCPYIFPDTSVGSCRSPASKTSNINFPEVFGDQSSCFQNTLSQSGSALSYDAAGCFEAQCSLSGSTYTLTVTVGTQTVTCTGAASKKVVTGFNGLFNCPNANDYCGAKADTFCNYGCLGRGSCVNQKCVCKDGWTDEGCGKRQLVLKCSRCGGKTPNCYGDSCVSGVIVRLGLMSLLGLIIMLFV